MRTPDPRNVEQDDKATDDRKRDEARRATERVQRKSRVREAVKRVARNHADAIARLADR